MIYIYTYIHIAISVLDFHQRYELATTGARRLCLCWYLRRSGAVGDGDLFFGKNHGKNMEFIWDLEDLQSISNLLKMTFWNVHKSGKMSRKSTWTREFVGQQIPPACFPQQVPPAGSPLGFLWISMGFSHMDCSGFPPG